MAQGKGTRMVTLLITLIVVVVVAGLAYWALHRLAAAFGLPAPIVAVLDVVIVVAAVLYLLFALAGGRFPLR